VRLEIVPLLLNHLVLVRYRLPFCPRPVRRGWELVPVLTVKCVVTESTPRRGDLLKHERQSGRLDLVSEMSRPFITHSPASTLVVKLHFPIFCRVPLMLVSSSALPASDKPVEAVKVNVRGNVLKQRLGNGPANDCGYVRFPCALSARRLSDLHMNRTAKSSANHLLRTARPTFIKARVPNQDCQIVPTPIMPQFRARWTTREIVAANPPQRCNVLQYPEF
jgi:hypothetical protein